MHNTTDKENNLHTKVSETPHSICAVVTATSLKNNRVKNKGSAAVGKITQLGLAMIDNRQNNSFPRLVDLKEFCCAATEGREVPNFIIFIYVLHLYLMDMNKKLRILCLFPSNVYFLQNI